MSEAKRNSARHRVCADVLVTAVDFALSAASNPLDQLQELA
jgi:hypothetical protein